MGGSLKLEGLCCERSLENFYIADIFQCPVCHRVWELKDSVWQEMEKVKPLIRFLDQTRQKASSY